MTDSNSIQPGDLVECIDPTDAADFLVRGKQYRVFTTRDGYVYLDAEDVNRHRGWYPSRFIKITQPQPKEHTMPTQDTWTADEIRNLVMEYGEGCREGKVAFLREQFNIDPDPQTIEHAVTVTLDVPELDERGIRNDRSDVVSAVRSVLREESTRNRILEILDSDTEFARENWSVG